MKRFIIPLVIVIAVLTTTVTAGATTPPPPSKALHYKVTHETAAQLVKNAPYGSKATVTNTHPKTDFSVGLGWVWYFHFSHDDVESFDWYQAVGSLGAALLFACGMVAEANPIAGAACGAYVLSAGLYISVVMHSAQNRSGPVAAWWKPMVLGPLGWVYPTVYEKWYGVTLKMNYDGSPAGVTYDFPSCPC